MTSEEQQAKAVEEALGGVVSCYLCRRLLPVHLAEKSMWKANAWICGSSEGQMCVHASRERELQGLSADLR
jgi:hypothetical protein